MERNILMLMRRKVIQLLFSFRPKFSVFDVCLLVKNVCCIFFSSFFFYSLPFFLRPLSQNLVLNGNGYFEKKFEVEVTNFVNARSTTEPHEICSFVIS